MRTYPHTLQQFHFHPQHSVETHLAARFQDTVRLRDGYHSRSYSFCQRMLRALASFPQPSDHLGLLAFLPRLFVHRVTVPIHFLVRQHIPLPPRCDLAQALARVARDMVPFIRNAGVLNFPLPLYRVVEYLLRQHTQHRAFGSAERPISERCCSLPHYYCTPSPVPYATRNPTAPATLPFRRHCVPLPSTGPGVVSRTLPALWWRCKTTLYTLHAFSNVATRGHFCAYCDFQYLPTSYLPRHGGRTVPPTV